MGAPTQQFRKTANLFLSGEIETYATVLLGIALRTYGAEVIGWDPDTIESQLKQDFMVDIPDVVYDQLMGLINVLATDSVYWDVGCFDRTVGALCRCGVEAQHDMPTPEELGWAVFEICSNDPDPYGKGAKAVSPFSHDVALYCGVVLNDAGLKRPPKSLEFAQMPYWGPQDVKDEPGEFESAYHSQEELGSFIDQFVEKNFLKMAEHLEQLGIEPATAAQEESAELPKDQLAGFFPG
jgi:hypothetical protein